MTIICHINYLIEGGVEGYLINVLIMTKVMIMLGWSWAHYETNDHYDDHDDHWRLYVEEAVQAIEASVAEDPRFGMHSKV